MTEEAENMALELLRRIRASQDRTEGDIADLKLRMSSVENHLGQMQIQMGQMQIQFAGVNQRMDRIEERLARVERRLDLVDA